jgi:glutamate decarboxylase
MALHAKVDETQGTAELSINPVYCQDVPPVPRHQIPSHPMPPDTALQLIKDELILDGNARLNLATFVRSSCTNVSART